MRFAPTTAGEQSCTIETGTGCASVAASGLGELAASCEVTPTTLSFGTVVVGQTADRTFTITNTGGQTLSGNVTLSCPAYSVVGASSYSLTAGESADITVRFAPTTAGEQSCTIETGAGCASVGASGLGELAASCEVEPTTLSFGTVLVGQSTDRTFTITNTGGQTLNGSVTLSCPAYSVVGSSSYSLTGGEAATFTVRFAPTTAGEHSCTIETGAGCASVIASGLGELAASCEVAPTALSFGTVVVGQTADRTFTITNTGGQILGGSVTLSCPAYSVVGASSYSLTGGEAATFTVRFAPSTAGEHSCTIETGTGCASVGASGLGELAASCEVEPTTLSFGTVLVGQSTDRTFTITNTGGQTLSGSVTLSCAAYSVVGASSYSLTAGQSADITVRFEPTEAGPQSCTIDPGTLCTSVEATGTGQLPGECEVSPTSLSFGTVVVGQSADRTFTITNTGGQTLTGSVTLSCPAFSLVESSTYSLTAGQSDDFTVRFAPTAAGPQSCTIDTGALCASVGASGTGELPASCEVMPTTLAFGTILVGQIADRTFTITNTGGQILSGNVTLSCQAYSVVGASNYSLTGGESQTITVRFAPTVAGPQSCTIDIGLLCASVGASGTGELAAACAVEPTTLTFGAVEVGEASDQTFTITNTGGQTLSGSVVLSCAAFSVVGPSGYSLTGGQSQTITVRFEPPAEGAHACTIDTGALCADVQASGSGQLPSDCEVSPTALLFGPVVVGQVADLTFTITNRNSQPLVGSVSLSCVAFSLVGAVAYNLAQDQSQVFTVRFAPPSVGSFSCTLDTGASCADVVASGTGQSPPLPVCAVDSTSLRFGSVEVGQSSDRSFSITNVGGGTLSGSVTEECAAYSIVSGGGSYELTAGQTRTVTVCFAPPSAGEHGCTIDTGASCASVAASGNGTVTPVPVCAVDSTMLRFGSVEVGQSSDLSFSITNVGGGTLSGSVTEECAAYSIVSGGGSYELTAGQTRTVTVCFAPPSAGEHGCTIDTGASCASVAASGNGTVTPVPVCAVDSTMLRFGSVEVGQSSDLSFSITNVGGGTLSGSVTEECVAYVIVSGGGSYSLTAGQSKAITVRFTPPSAGEHGCTISTGASCASVAASGNGTVTPVPTCVVEPTILAFGSVPIEDADTLSFTIENTGGGDLSGNVTEGCAAYSILSGGGSFTLSAGQTRTVTLRFAPVLPGAQNCEVSLGTPDCDPVGCTGAGTILPGLVFVSAGTFTMGSPPGEPGRGVDEAQHGVALSKALLVSRHEVTQSEWQSVMGWNASSLPGSSDPVETITWFDCVNYCNRRSAAAGLDSVYVMTGRVYFPPYDNIVDAASVTCDWTKNGYRLLTEAEWEYVCRGGTSSAYCNGGITYEYGCQLDPNLDLVGWFCGNAGAELHHDVGLKDANAWGFRDAHGNVSEWVWDAYAAYPAGPVTDPTGPGYSGSSNHVLRGGSGASWTNACRSACRDKADPSTAGIQTGFRVARKGE